MKKFNAIYFFLFILLVMGAFAAMAQNSYGLKILGGVAFTFSLMFIIEFITRVKRKENKDVFTKIEPVCLFILSFIFGLRVFYIHFKYVELLFGIAAALLAIIYLRKMMLRYNEFRNKNKVLSALVIVFHLSIIFFLASLALVPFLPVIAESIGIASFVLLMLFILVGFLKKNLLVEGEPLSAFQMIRQYKGHSIIIITLIIMLSFYVGFNKVGILPGVYSDEFPRAYFKLVDDATKGKEKAVDGTYKHEEFMDQYKKFINNNK